MNFTITETLTFYGSPWDAVDKEAEFDLTAHQDDEDPDLWHIISRPGLGLDYYEPYRESVLDQAKVYLAGITGNPSVRVEEC